MAYNAIAQNEHDALFDDAHSNISGSPPPMELSFQPLSLDFTDLIGSLFINDATKPAEQERPRPTAPSAATSYDMLDDDDYEEPQTNLANTKAETEASQRHAVSLVPQQILNADRPPLPPPHKNPSERSTNRKMTWQNNDEPIIIPRTTSPEPMMRTASSEGSVDLRHPAPDLQSLQGAYVGNVERLERSAERLSMTLNIGVELEKLKQEQKRSESRRSSMRASMHGDGTSHSPTTRKFSTHSVANSIIDINSAARSGGYSPGGYFSPHGGSFRSGSFTQPAGLRMTQRSSHDQDQGDRQVHSVAHNSVPVISAPVPRRNSRDLLLGKDTLPEEGPAIPQTAQATDTQPRLDVPADHDRPTTAASVDTFQQANQLFTDFDGVHFAPTLQDPSALTTGQYGTRRVSSNNNNVVSRQSYANPLGTDKGMVYYPAPVPMMLNLPKRISKLPSVAQREQRRSQVLDSIPPTIKLSANWLPGVEEVSASAEDLSLDDRRQSKPLANRRSMTALNMPPNLPPQLRASVFFDQPGAGQDVEVQGDSAVATLDSILDASAHAPVGAFTDHPIVGRVGAEVYGKEHTKRHITSSPLAGGNLKKKASRDELKHARKKGNKGSRASLGFLLKRRQGEDGESDDDEDEDRKNNDEHQLSPAEEERMSQYDEDEEGTEEDDDFEAETGPYMGAPTTLLAELQMRKQEQRMRNRSAANAFPNGMHSTLLELDAVAQLQKNSRRNKRVALAWEDPNAHGPESDDEDDDDVPLAIIYASKLNQRDEDRPLGLMEKRELEDNEPLSKRRERLKGGPDIPRNPSPHKRASTMFQLEVPHFTAPNNGADSDEEEETLAQRLKRLKAKGTATGLDADVGSEFANDLLGKFGAEKDVAEKDKSSTKGVGRESPEEETLGQRRRRLQAEREAKAKEAVGPERPGLNKRRSMADILQAHPATGAGFASNEPSRAPAMGGLLYQQQQLQEQRNQQLREQNMYSVRGAPDGPLVNVGQERPAPPVGGLLYQQQQQQQYRNTLGGGLHIAGGMGMATPGYGGYGGGMDMNGFGHQATINTLSGLNGFASAPAVSAAAGRYAGGQGAMMQQMAALDARQREMVERWRQSVMQ